MTKEQARKILEDMGFCEVNINGCFINNHIQYKAYIEYDVRVSAYHICIYDYDNT